MRRAAYILAAVLLSAAAVRAEDTNAVPPSVVLNVIDTTESARAFRALVEFRRKVATLEDRNPHGETWLRYRLRLIESTAKADPAKAETMIAETLAQLRAWGAEI